YITKAKQTEIPDVKGLSVTEAIKTLQDAGFIVADDQIEEPNESVDEGKVSKTSPAAGSKRKEGFEVKLYISQGDTKISIEDYTGKSSVEIKARLEALGVSVLIEKEDVNPEEGDYKENIILRQSVAAGEKLSVGDMITLYIPKLDTKYPDFLNEGYTIEEVQDFAEEMGLSLTIQEVVTTEYEAGTVFYQSRAAGTTVLSGATLRVRVAKAADSTIDDGEDENPDEGKLD
ncbi:MAG: PASTA domain-containing protein, partial [Bacilli bacterium]|nr:PASTA domain-containing protein [Bacilli bacterium]